ncbi:GLYcosylation related [Caenorhabditis elegans]|uniref:GLYcosylation related n=1 Tax=Caenorhabditis elegans TaxID=6239 RepID=Q93643_CAEEL|nr:GLYcosylation related [Caenorhabditis elegans]CAB03022.2 GLYcosylation related [Caenorhabditis elegans]
MVHYTRLSDNTDESLKKFQEPKWSIRIFIFIALLISFSILLTVSYKSMMIPNKFIVRLSGKERAPLKHITRSITKFADYYFTESESRYLNCARLIDGDVESIDTYVNNGRMKLDEEKLFQLSMDCDSIQNRIFRDMPPFEKLKRPIAFVRNIYGIYELQEVFLSISYHPDNYFCYAMDSKSSEKLKKSMRIMADCFENVIVLDKEYDMDRAGHKQDAAHFDCLKQILDEHWSHAITLQNFDLIIKSPKQLSDLSEILNYTSIMGFDYGFTSRYRTFEDWTPAGMKLFKNEQSVPLEILHKKLKIRKSLNEVILSKVFVKSLFDKVNLQNVIKRFDDRTLFGVDEMMVMTLFENYLGLDGQMESNCTVAKEDILTRQTHWHLEQSDGLYQDCKSKWLRHSICVIGVEFLQELSKSPMVIANKVTANFDFGTIICVREMIKTNKTGNNPDSQWLSYFPQFREMLLKANGTYYKNSFQC